MYLFGHRLSWSNTMHFLRQGAAVVGLVIAIAGSFHLPVGIRSDLILVSGGLLAGEHFAAAQAKLARATTTVADPTSLSLSVSSPTKGQP